MKYGIGFILGSKQSPLNWIHINDVARLVKKAIENNKYKGPYNLANDNEMSQYKFIKTIKSTLFPYSLIIKIPSYLIHIIFGKRSLIFNTNITLSVEKLKKTGFIWECNKLENLLNKK